MSLVKEEMRESPRGNSMISEYTSCQRKWAWKYLKGFKSTAFNEALSFGSVIHEAQAVWYSDWSYRGMMAKANEMIRGIGNIPENQRREFRDKVLFTLKTWYTEWGQYEPEEVETLAVEKQVDLTLPNGFIMSMRWDRLLRSLKTREVFVSDTKTTGWSYGNTLRNYMDSAQPMLYILSVKENEPELFKDLSGWRTDCLYVKTLKTKTNHEFGRSEVTRPSPLALEDCRNSYASHTSNISYALQDVEAGIPISIAFPRNFGNCNAYFKPCPYLHICHRIDEISSPPEHMEIDPWLAEKTVLSTFEGLR